MSKKSSSTSQPVVPAWLQQGFESAMSRGNEAYTAGLAQPDLNWNNVTAPQITAQTYNPVTGQAITGTAPTGQALTGQAVTGNAVTGNAATFNNASTVNPILFNNPEYIRPEWVSTAAAVDPLQAERVSGQRSADFIGDYINSPFLNDQLSAAASDYDAQAGRGIAQNALNRAANGSWGALGDAGAAQYRAESDRGRASLLAGIRSNAYAQALQAAGGDASRLQQAAQANQGAQLTADTTSAGLEAQRRAANAAIQNRVTEQNVGISNMTNQGNVAIGNQAQQFNAGQLNNIGMYNTGALNDMTRTNLAAQNQFGLANLGAQNQYGLANLSALNNMASQNLGLAGQYGLANLGAQNQYGLANLDAQNQAGQFNTSALNNASALNSDAALRAALANSQGQFNAGSFNRQYPMDLFNSYILGPLGASQGMIGQRTTSNDGGAGLLNVLGGLGAARILKSDIRVKTDIHRVGTLDNGLPVYSYRYKSGGPYQIGVMAQDVEKVKPHAVVEIAGIKHVNYAEAVQ